MRIIFLLLFISCGKQTIGCENIGHRLGENPDNTIESIYSVIEKESDDCFKAWEFDVNSAKDQLIVTHDHKQRGKRVMDFDAEYWRHPLPQEIIDTLLKLEIKKKVHIDIKIVKKEHWNDLLIIYDSFKSRVPVSFITHCSRREYDFVKFIQAIGYNINFYRC